MRDVLAYKLYEVLSARDYYVIEDGRTAEVGNLIYTDDNFYCVEWWEKDDVRTHSKDFQTIELANDFIQRLMNGKVKGE